MPIARAGAEMADAPAAEKSFWTSTPSPSTPPERSSRRPAHGADAATKPK